MDFNSLGVGHPFYILQKADKPTLQVGVIKSKSEPRSQYHAQQPNIFSGLAAMQGQNNIMDIVVTVGNSDIPFSNIPVSAETATYNNGNTFVSCSREATLQAVDGMMQASKKALEQVDYHNAVLTEGENMLEILNPHYKEEKERDRNLKALENRQCETDKKIDVILSKLNELFASSKKNP